METIQEKYKMRLANLMKQYVLDFMQNQDEVNKNQVMSDESFKLAGKIFLCSIPSLQYENKKVRESFITELNNVDSEQKARSLQHRYAIESKKNIPVATAAVKKFLTYTAERNAKHFADMYSYYLNDIKNAGKNWSDEYDNAHKERQQKKATTNLEHTAEKNQEGHPVTELNNNLNKEGN